MELWQMVAALVTGGGVVAIIKAVSDSIKTKATEERTTDAQEFSQLESVAKEMRTRIIVLERARDDCLERYAETAKKLGHLEGRLDEQSINMKHLQQIASSQSMDAVKLAGEVAAKGVVVAAQLLAASSSNSGTLKHDNPPIEVVVKNEEPIAVIDTAKVDD